MPSVKLRPTQDAFVEIAEPGVADLITSYGRMHVGVYTIEGSEGAYSDYTESRGYILFDLSSIPAGSTITSAVLRMFVVEEAGFYVLMDVCDIRRCTDVSWTRASLTWNNQPTSGSIESTILASHTGGDSFPQDPVDFNLTTSVQAAFSAGKVCWRFTSPVFIDFSRDSNTVLPSNGNPFNLTIPLQYLTVDYLAPTSGSLALTLNDVTSVAAGVNITHGASISTLGAATSTAAGVNITHGSSTPTLDATVAADGIAFIQGVLVQVFEVLESLAGFILPPEPPTPTPPASPPLIALDVDLRLTPSRNVEFESRKPKPGAELEAGEVAGEPLVLDVDLRLTPSRNVEFESRRPKPKPSKYPPEDHGAVGAVLDNAFSNEPLYLPGWLVATLDDAVLSAPTYGANPEQEMGLVWPPVNFGKQTMYVRAFIVSGQYFRTYAGHSWNSTFTDGGNPSQTLIYSPQQWNIRRETFVYWHIADPNPGEDPGPKGSPYIPYDINDPYFWFRSVEGNYSLIAQGFDYPGANGWYTRPLFNFHPSDQQIGFNYPPHWDITFRAITENPFSYRRIDFDANEGVWKLFVDGAYRYYCVDSNQGGAPGPMGTWIAYSPQTTPGTVISGDYP